MTEQQMLLHYRSYQYENAIQQWERLRNNPDAIIKLGWAFEEYQQVSHLRGPHDAKPSFPTDLYDVLPNHNGNVYRALPSSVTAAAFAWDSRNAKQYAFARLFAIAIYTETTVTNTTQTVIYTGDRW